MEHPLADYMHPLTPSAAPPPTEREPEGSETTAVPLGAMERIGIHDAVIEALRTCYDPEIPVDIYELGLIYDIAVGETGVVSIKMTLTAPNCPAAQILPGEVKQKAEEIPGVRSADVEVVWEPPWDMTKMTEAAKLQLGMI